MAAREAADIFCDSNATPELIGAAGLRIFVLLYGGKNTDNLSSLRYAKYMKMPYFLLSNQRNCPQQIDRIEYFHSLRVYYQILEWNFLHKDSSNANKLGWKLQDGILIPVLTDEAPAPDGLLYVIRCNCKVSSKRPCGGSCCSYRRNGLHCVATYGDCRGTECQNCDKCEASTDDTDQVRNFYDDACDYLFGNLIFNHYLKLAQLVFYWNVLT